MKKEAIEAAAVTEAAEVTEAKAAKVDEESA
jgi:hypothetical protein